MRTPGLQEFKLWARQNNQLARAVCLAQAFAECERARVDAYIQPIFETFGFEYGKEITRGQHTGLIPTPRDLYLCEDEAGLARFYAACDAAYRAHGFKGEDGHCPALEAENMLMVAQRALIEAAEPLFGVSFNSCYGEQRKNLLNLLLGACLKSNERKAA